jgi:hypothetical protein
MLHLAADLHSDNEIWFPLMYIDPVASLRYEDW